MILSEKDPPSHYQRITAEGIEHVTMLFRRLDLKLKIHDIYMIRPIATMIDMVPNKTIVIEIEKGWLNSAKPVPNYLLNN